MSHNIISVKLSSQFGWWVSFKFMYAYMYRYVGRHLAEILV